MTREERSRCESSVPAPTSVTVVVNLLEVAELQERAAVEARLTTMKRSMVAGIVLVAVTGCTSHAPKVEPGNAGTVRGRMIFMGGPRPGAGPVTPGVVTLQGASTTTVTVDSHGRFQVTTGPGTYHVTGTSPKFGHSTYFCRATHPVVVAPATTSHVVVGCLVR